MKLYYSPGACSLAPHIALHEAGLDFSIEGVNLKTKHFKNGDFNKVNPKGYVPALALDDGQILTEVAVILQYIADQKSSCKLIPEVGTMERYRCLEWLNFIATEIHKNFSPLWHEDYPAKAVELTKEKLATRFDYLTTQLEGKTYLMGLQYSIADAYLFTILNWSNFLKLDLSKWPMLTAYMERIKNRPATQAAINAEKSRSAP